MGVRESVPCREFIVQIIQFKGPSYTKEMASGLQRRAQHFEVWQNFAPETLDQVQFATEIEIPLGEFSSQMEGMIGSQLQSQEWVYLRDRQASVDLFLLSHSTLCDQACVQSQEGHMISDLEAFRNFVWSETLCLAALTLFSCQLIQINIM